MSITCYSVDVAMTRAVGAALADCLRPTGILLLSGDLGSGKTVLTQGVARGLGIDEREVQSPSYTLIREHRGAVVDLVHVDLYRLAPAEVEQLGLWEMLAGVGVKIVEWAERLPFEITDAMRIALSVEAASGIRRIEVEGADDWIGLRAELERITEPRT